MISAYLYLANVQPDTWFPVAVVSSLSLGNGGTTAADRIRAFPTPMLASFGCDRTIDEVGVRAVTSAVGEEVRVGLYLDDGSGYPGDLLVDFGAFSVATVGPKTAAASQLIDCTAGPLWAVTWQSSNAQLRGLPVDGFGPALGLTEDFGTDPTIGWDLPQVYTVGTSVFPATFPAGALRLTHPGGFYPTFFVHFEAP